MHVVDEDVDGTEGIERTIDHLLHVLAVPDVADDVGRCPAGSVDLGRDRLELGFRATGERHVRSTVGEHQCDPAAEALPCAGHDGGLAGQVHVSASHLSNGLIRT